MSTVKPIEGDMEKEQPPALRYISQFRKRMDKMVKFGAIFGLVACIIQLIKLIAVWNTRTSWLTKVPCSFQESLTGFANLTSIAAQLIELGTILPGIGFVVYGIYYIRPLNRNADVMKWKPMDTRIISVFYCGKILTPVLVYSAINFKLPSYVPYKEMSTKACGVTASLALFPPGRDGTVVNDTYAQLRNMYSSYLSNDANLEYPAFSEWERNLVSLNTTKAGIEKDDGIKCRELGAQTNGSLEILNKYLAPPPGVQKFCDDGYEMGVQKLALSGSDALQFPLKTLSKQFTNLFSAIPLVYYGCSTSVKDVLTYTDPDTNEVVTKKIVVNQQIAIHEVCTALHSSKSYASIDAKYAPFITQDTFDKYNKPISLFKTEDEKQLACLVAADLTDPKTGFNGLAGYLCPSWVAFQTAKKKQMDYEKANPTEGLEPSTEAQLNEGSYGDNATPLSREFPEGWVPMFELTKNLATNPFSTAVTKGYFVFDKNVKVTSTKSDFTWSDLGLKITDVIFSLHKSNVMSQDEKTKTGRWTIQDPRSFAQLGANQLASQMKTLYESAEKLITVSKKSIKNQLNQVSYDFEYGVDTDWTPDGTQEDEQCGPESDYPTTANECTSLKSNGEPCAWNAATSKCGFKVMTFSTFRTELAEDNNYRANKLLNDIASKLTVNMKSIYSMYQDLKTTSLIGMLKTSQLVSEKTFDATNAAIRLVRYVIGTYVGFGVVSKLLPFSLSIVGGVKKGTIAFGKVTTTSKAFEIKGDQLSLQKFNALLLFISGLVVAVPIVTIGIFFYQAYAEQYFVLVVVAMEIWAVGQAFKGFMTDRQNKMVLVSSGSLGLAGFICWVVFDENAMFITEYLVAKAGKIEWGVSLLKIITVIVNAGFNYFFSQVLTLQLIAKLSANMFAHGASGKMIYEETDADGTVHRTPSNLAALGIFSMKNRQDLLQQMEKDSGVEMTTHPLTLTPTLT